MQSQSNSTPPSPTSSQTEAQSAAPATDPLEEASPFSLEELMNRAPQISDTEAEQIIAYLRAQREKFAQQEAAPKVKKVPKAKGPKPTLSVDELLSGLD
jgi:hypothetical protein